MARGARRIFFPKRTAPPCEFDGFDGPVKTSAGLGPYYPLMDGTSVRFATQDFSDTVKP